MVTEAVFEDIRLERENLLWVYKPDLLTYLISYRQLWWGVGFSILFVSSMFIAEISTAERLVPWYFFPVFVGVTLLLTTLFVIGRVLGHQEVAYALSERRVLIREGSLFGRTKAIDIGSVKRIEVRRDLLNYISKTGDIRLYTEDKTSDELGFIAQAYDQLESVKQPDAILRMMGQASGRR